METQIARLERIADRLERLELEAKGHHASVAPPSALPPPQLAATSVPATPTPSGSASFLQDYDVLLSNCLKPLVSTSSQVNAEAQAAIKHLEKAFLSIRGILEVVAQSKKPDMATFQQLLAPVAAEMVEASKLAEGRRSPSFNHVKAVAEALQALSWLAYTGPETGMNPPPQHVADCWSSAEFFANKVLMEYRSAGSAAAAAVEPNITWVRALKELLKKLEAFVGTHFPNGLKWNAAGGSTAAARTTPTPAAAAPAPPPPQPPAPRPAGPRGPPPPPGPPPKAPSPKDLADDGPSSSGASSQGAGSNAVLFAELQKGEAITSGLRKVTPDMKTKNQPDRVGHVAVTPKAQPSTSAPAAKPAAAPAKPPVLEFDANRKKWTIENQVGVCGLKLEEAQASHSVYIFNCRDTVIQVPGKVNAISLDSCTKTGVVFGDLISSCEAVNCSRLQLQCTGAVSTLAIEKTDGVQLYLPEALATQKDAVRIITAKCSEVNVVVVPVSQEADPQEHPIPEQFVSSFKDGKLVTETVAHSGA